MYCKNCGRQISDHANYCGWCGTEQDQPRIEGDPGRKANGPKGSRMVRIIGILAAFVIVAALVIFGVNKLVNVLNSVYTSLG